MREARGVCRANLEFRRAGMGEGEGITAKGAKSAKDSEKSRGEMQRLK